MKNYLLLVIIIFICKGTVAQDKIQSIPDFDSRYIEYHDLRKALKNPDQVYVLNLTLEKINKTRLKKITKFKNLEKLNLTMVGLDYFPEELLLCRNLKYLNLDHNRIQSLPKEIWKLKKLETLILSRNLID